MFITARDIRHCHHDIFFQAGQLINYGRQDKAKLATSDNGSHRMLQPWWIIVKDVTAGGNRMFLKDILNELWPQDGMTRERCEKLVSRASYLIKEKLKEYVTHTKMLHEDPKYSNVAFELTLQGGQKYLHPSDLDGATCGLESAELIDWALWTDKYVGKHTLVPMSRGTDNYLLSLGMRGIKTLRTYSGALNTSLGFNAKNPPESGK
jgi:hypothetical protein